MVWLCMPYCSPTPGSTFLLGFKGENPSPGPTLMKEPCPPWAWPSLPPTATVWNQSPAPPAWGTTPRLPAQPATDLIQLEGDHGDRMEDGGRGPGDGGDALGAGALRDGDPGTALRGQTRPGSGAPSPLPCQEPVCCPPTKPQPTAGNSYHPRALISHPKWWRSGKRGGRDLPSPPSQMPWAALPNSILTCSRIRFTVSPFCGRKNMEWLLA